MNSACLSISAAEVTSLLIREFDAYWRRKKGQSAAPLMAALDPAEIPSLLPYLVIAQVSAHPFEVRYRLVGTRVVEAHGADYTNRRLDECGFLIEAELLACYRRVMDQAQPQFLYYQWEREEWPRPRGRIGASEAGFFPFSTDGSAIDRVVSIADPGIAPRGAIAG